jgi:hypothetical protein
MEGQAFSPSYDLAPQHSCGIGIEADAADIGIPESCILLCSGTGLGSLIPVPDRFRHQSFCSFRYQID